MVMSPATLTEAELWNHYARAYDSTVTQTWFYRELQKKALDFLSKSSRVLDVACGAGNYAMELARQGKAVYAVDSSELMIEHARQKINGLEVVVKQDSSEAFDIWPRNFDGALCINALYAFEHPEGALFNIYRHLLTGGLVVLSGPKPGGLGEVLVDACRQELEGKENSEELIAYMKIVGECNRMIGGFMRTFSSSELSSLLLETGFSEIVYADDHSYLDQNHFVVARK